MLSQNLRALCSAPGGSGIVLKNLQAQVRSPGVSGGIACGFRTELHFLDGGTSIPDDADWVMKASHGFLSL
jgi:hypothetical protein